MIGKGTAQADPGRFKIFFINLDPRLASRSTNHPVEAVVNRLTKQQILRPRHHLLRPRLATPGRHRPNATLDRPRERPQKKATICDMELPSRARQVLSQVRSHPRSVTSTCGVF